MEVKNEFTKLQPKEFSNWLMQQNVSRTIKLIQLHHTWQPNYSTFKSYPDGFTLQRNMKTYHVQSNGWADIAQHFSIFPDGSIITGRSLNTNPAGIYGGNTGAICIENVGNFDSGGDAMTEAQKEAIVIVVQALMTKFKLNTSSVRYHCWYTSGGTYLGDYDKNQSAKTCPGTNFFGGNTKSAFNKNLKPLLEGKVSAKEEKPMTEVERQALAQLVAKVDTLNNAFQEHLKTAHQTYDYMADLPDWCKPIVRKGLELGMLKGTGTDASGNLKLGLTINDIKALAYDLRENGYKV